MRRIIPFLLLFVVLALPACREQSKEEVFQQGMIFVEADNYQAAVSLFKKALNQDPNYIDARMQLGIAYQETDKLDKAEKELEKVLRQDPDNQNVSLRLAEIYLETKRPDKAIHQLDNVQGSSANNSEALRILAESHAMMGDLTLAEELFRKSLLNNPEYSSTQLGLAQLFYMTDRGSEGDSLVHQVITQNPEDTNAYYLLLRKSLNEGVLEDAIKSLEKITAIDSDDIVAAYILGMLYLDAGRIVAARKIAANLTEHKPNHPAGYRIEGVALYQKGDFENAIGKLQQSIKGMPDLPGYYFLGLASYKYGQLEQALSSFQKALDKSPTHDSSRLMLAQTFLKQGHVDDCIQQVRLVIEGDTKNANAYNILGSAYLLQGEYDLAMEQIETAIQINPKLAQAHLKKGLFNLATGKKEMGESDLFNAVNAAPEILNTRLLLATYYLRQNNYPLALQILEEGLTISPDSALIYNLMAASKFGQNQPKEAIRLLEKAKALKPDYTSPYFNLANYYINQKEYQAALQEYQAVIHVLPGYAPAMLKAATLYELLNQNEEAESFYKRSATDRNPQGHLALAAFYKRSDRQVDSLQTLKVGYNTIPDSPDLNIAYAEALKGEGLFDEAILVYIHLEEIRPGLGKPLLLGTHILKGDYSAAKEIAERTIAEAPSSWQGYIFMSAIHEKRSEWSLAEEQIKRGLAATNENIALTINLARIYTKQSAYDKALKVYDEILRKKPDLIQVSFSKGAILDLVGDKKKAQQIYEAILDSDENYVPALNNLACLLLDIYGDKKRALELAGKGFRLKPQDPRIIDTLGYALLKNDQVKESVVFLEKASSVLPDDVSVQIHLAQAYKAAGRNEDALASLTNINETKAQKSQLQEARALMKELN